MPVVCVYSFFVALTAPGFGTAATTTAAAPATGFSFGSTNTGKIHVFCTKHVTLNRLVIPVSLQELEHCFYDL